MILRTELSTLSEMVQKAPSAPFFFHAKGTMSVIHVRPKRVHTLATECTAREICNNGLAFILEDENRTLERHTSLKKHIELKGAKACPM